MSKKTAAPPTAPTAVEPAATPPDVSGGTLSPAPPTLSVVLQGGPAEMQFCGRLWRRDQPQTIPAEHWAGMQSRNAARLGFTVLITTPAEEN